MHPTGGHSGGVGLANVGAAIQLPSNLRKAGVCAVSSGCLLAPWETEAETLGPHLK